MIKNKAKVILAAGLGSFLSTACVSTKTTTDIIEEYAKDTLPPEPVVVEEVHIPTPAEIFAEKISGLSLTVVSAPTDTTIGKAFKKPYSIKVTDSENKPVADIAVQVSVPSKMIKGEVEFKASTIHTDSNGSAEFLPEIPQRSFNSQVKFAFDGDFADAEIKSKSMEKEVSASFKVQTNLKNAGGVIAVVDFNQNGRPITSNPVSSSNFLMSLMQLGFTRIGNIDLTNQVLNGDTAQLQKGAKAMVGNTSQFLIYGTVKYESVEKVEEGSKVTLIGDIKCISLKDGSMLYSATKKVSETNKNEWNALAAARKAISDQFAQDLKYGI